MKLGDFSVLAKNYINRPAYDMGLINKIMEHMGVAISNVSIADVGAGTGQLTKVLAEMGCSNILAVEPNDEMRKEGKTFSSCTRPLRAIKTARIPTAGSTYCQCMISGTA